VVEERTGVGEEEPPKNKIKFCYIHNCQRLKVISKKINKFNSNYEPMIS